MEKHITLSVPKSCSEQWDNFTPTSTGGFCSSCSKNVVDFTKMNDREILDYFRNKPLRVCGRFRKDQLKNYSHHVPHTVQPGFTLLKAGVLSLFFVLINKQGFTQNASLSGTPEIVQVQQDQTIGKMVLKVGQPVHGVIRSADDHTPLPGVSIYLKGSTQGTVSDANGAFKFPVELEEGDVLVFSFIGMETKEYVISKNQDSMLEIFMKNDYVVMMGDVVVDGAYTPHESAFQKVWHKVKALF